MAEENELIKLREELKQVQEATRRSRRRGAFGFVILIFALIVCLLYAFVQQVAATKNAEEALRQHEMAETNAEEARRQEAIAKEQTAAAIKAREMAVAAMQEAEERIAKCKGKK